MSLLSNLPVNPFAKDELLKCSGYVSNFIFDDLHIDIKSILSDQQKESLPSVEGNIENLLHYTNLSVLYNSHRKIPFLSAYNIDGNLKTEKAVSRASSFKQDPRIDIALQLNDDFYDIVTNMIEFEIGHMASHNELSWGEDAKYRSHQTFHFTNSVPQVKKLNGGLWSKLESYIIKETNEASNQKICVITGPMVKDSDPVYIFEPTFQVPLFFFKLVIFPYNNKIYSTAFVMSQYKVAKKLGLIDESTEVSKMTRAPKPEVPFMDYNHHEVFQVDISLIESYTRYKLSWDGIERIKIKTLSGTNKLKNISKIGEADDIDKMSTIEYNLSSGTGIILPSN